MENYNTNRTKKRPRTISSSKAHNKRPVKRRKKEYDKAPELFLPVEIWVNILRCLRIELRQFVEFMYISKMWAYSIMPMCRYEIRTAHNKMIDLLCHVRDQKPDSLVQLSRLRKITIEKSTGLDTCTLQIGNLINTWGRTPKKIEDNRIIVGDGEAVFDKPHLRIVVDTENGIDVGYVRHLNFTSDSFTCISGLTIQFNAKSTVSFGTYGRVVLDMVKIINSGYMEVVENPYTVPRLASRTIPHYRTLHLKNTNKFQKASIFLFMRHVWRSDHINKLIVTNSTVNINELLYVCGLFPTIIHIHIFGCRISCDNYKTLVTLEHRKDIQTFHMVDCSIIPEIDEKSGNVKVVMDTKFLSYVTRSVSLDSHFLERCSSSFLSALCRDRNSKLYVYVGRDGLLLDVVKHVIPYISRVKFYIVCGKDKCIQRINSVTNTINPHICIYNDIPHYVAFKKIMKEQ